MSPWNRSFNRFNEKICFGGTLKNPSGFRGNQYNESSVNSVNNTPIGNSLFSPVSPIRIPSLQVKKIRQARSFQNERLSRSLKRKSFDKYKENNCLSFPFTERDEALAKISNGLISELPYETMSPKNRKKKKGFVEQNNKSFHSSNESINLNVESLNINNLDDSVNVDEMVVESDATPKFWNEVSFKPQNDEISFLYGKSTNDNTCSEFLTPKDDRNDDSSDEGSIIQILSPIKIRNTQYLFNIEGVSNLDDNEDDTEYNRKLNSYPSQDNLENQSPVNYNFAFSQLKNRDCYEMSDKKSTVEDDADFNECSKKWSNLIGIGNEGTEIDTVNDGTFSYSSDEDSIVPETQFSLLSDKKPQYPSEPVQCFFEPPSQIFKADQNESIMNLKCNQRRGRPSRRLKPRQNYKWSWLHDSFTDYLNKSYTETQRQNHDMIVNSNLLRIEISLISSFPIWGIIFFKPSKDKMKENNVAVICPSSNARNIRMNCECILKIYPKYNFVVYSPYSKVIINPIINIL
uniref:RNase NYN domain-containing protein n=1 Tax=Strongyloides papillosus TaxID=174720 RepID=A0A0N5BWQ2_STREA